MSVGVGGANFINRGFAYSRECFTRQPHLNRVPNPDARLRAVIHSAKPKNANKD